MAAPFRPEPYLLPPLKFDFNALEPLISAADLEVHHDLHHRGYVDRLNDVLAPYPEWQGLTIEALLRRLDELPRAIREEVRFEGGGHANHQFLWKIIAPPRDSAPVGVFADAIAHHFGDLAGFSRAFEDAAADLRGDGWAFLVTRPRRGYALEILTLPDNGSVLPLTEPAPGLLICDLWAHAGWREQASNSDPLASFWQLVDWEVVSRRFDGVLAGAAQL